MLHSIRTYLAAFAALGVVLCGTGSVARAATIPDDVAKWASSNLAVVHSAGCDRNRGSVYCTTQEGADKLIAMYNASKQQKQ
jgi:hypothetical protein